MFRIDLGSLLVERYAVLRFAAFSAGGYLAWLIAFERWFEPLLRRCSGIIVGSPIVWVPAGGSFRMWGLKDQRRSRTAAAVGFLGGAAILCAAIFPAVALRVTAGGPGDDTVIAASSYLFSIPMIGGFVVRVLWRRTDTSAQRLP
jgi:Na+-transporting methylmalonyl-CoA/oxaloacetate decarboxylase beta subunit